MQDGNVDKHINIQIKETAVNLWGGMRTMWTQHYISRTEADFKQRNQ